MADDETMVELCLREAEHAATRVGDRNDYWTVFGPTNVDIHRVSTLVELGRTGQALRTADHVQADRSPSVERRLSYYLALARAYSQRREDGAAVAMLRRVEEESREEMQMSPLARELIAGSDSGYLRVMSATSYF